MRIPRRVLVALLVAPWLPLSLASADPPPVAGAQPPAPAEDLLPLAITEWEVPWPNTRPRDPAVAPDGRVWFVGQAGNYVASLDPSTGGFERVPLPEGARPHNVIVDPQGTPWYAGNGDRHIGRVDPATKELKRFDLPEGVDDPHTMVWSADGKIWFTAQHAARIGRLDPASGEVRTVEVPGDGPRPYGIVLDAQGRPWVAMLGTNAIGSVDPATMKLTLHRTPTEDSRIRRIAATSDGRIWWVDAARGHIGVFDPASDRMQQWQSPGGSQSGPYAMAADDRDRLWYVETHVQPNRFIGFVPASEQFVSITEVPSGGGAVRHMVFHAGTKALWFGTDTNTIGRAVVP
jgi:virginiamycin B lyase